MDSNLNFTIQALPGIPTTFNTSNNTTQAGTHGTGGPGGSDGSDGSALGNSIFLRTGSSLTFMAQNAGDLLTLGDQVAFTDDTSFGTGGTSVFVTGNGTVVYNGTTDYQGTITINNANFKVNGLIDTASISVCRNIGFSSQRGTLSGMGTLTGDVFVNSGTISPDTAETLTLGSLSLNPADPGSNTLGSLVHIEIASNNTSLVSVVGTALLAGTLEIDLDSNAEPGTYEILTSSAITGTFDFVTFTGTIPNYVLSYLPIENPTFVQFDFLGYSSILEVTITTATHVVRAGARSILNGTIEGGVAPYTIVWSDGFTQMSNTKNFSRLVKPRVTTTYRITEVTDDSTLAGGPSNSVALIVIPCVRR